LLALEGDHVSSFHLFVTKINLVSLCQNIYLQSSFHRMLCMNPTPSIVQFGKILTSLIKMKNYPTAISLSHRLEEFNGRITPDLITFNIMMNCYCHVDHINFSFSILAKIFKLGFHPDTVTSVHLSKVYVLKVIFIRLFTFTTNWLHKDFIWTKLVMVSWSMDSVNWEKQEQLCNCSDRWKGHYTSPMW
jgi:pentatricopeptide repeat protein